jgi:hypothetical protein
MRNRSGYERRPYGAEPRLFKWHPYESDLVDCVVEVHRERRAEQGDGRNASSICYARFTLRHFAFHGLRGSDSRLEFLLQGIRQNQLGPLLRMRPVLFVAIYR